jgi:hypothetical protein
MHRDGIFLEILGETIKNLCQDGQSQSRFELGIYRKPKTNDNQSTAALGLSQLKRRS